MRETAIVDWVLPLFVVSCAFLAAFFLTFWFLMPLQLWLMPDTLRHASLLFLPHGVRVLTAWLYGWKSIVLLAPASFAAHIYLFGLQGLFDIYILATVVGLLCAPFSFWLLAKLGMEFREGRAPMVSWREILLAGSVASLINGAGSTYFFGGEIRFASAYFMGDLGGLLTSMILLMLGFRWMRKAR